MKNKNSREIKFRFWDKEYKQWRELPDLYGDYQASAFRTYGDGFAIRHFLSGEAQEKVLSGKIAIQQFTGLLDKDGQEIYEGDIIQFYEGQPHQAEYEVYWKKCGFSLIDAKRDGDKYGVFTKNLDNLCPADSMTIIGNIFENPELCSTN